LRPDALRGVVLDLDDTLTDLSRFEAEVWDDVARVLASHVPEDGREEFRERYRRALEPNYQRVLDGELDMRAFRRARLAEALAPWSELDDELFEAYSVVKQRIVDEVPPKAGAHEALRSLRSVGLRLGVLTNGPSDLQRGKLERLGFSELVDAVAVSEEIGFAKPAPEAYEAVASRLGLRASSLVMVGDDWARDVAGPLAYGFAAAFYVGAEEPPPGSLRGAVLLESVADLPLALSSLLRR
jgi:putative hydrolase of the HAD superfamily